MFFSNPSLVETENSVYSVFSPLVHISSLILCYSTFKGLIRWHMSGLWGGTATRVGGSLLATVFLQSGVVFLGLQRTVVTNLLWGFTVFLLKVFRLFHVTISSTIFQNHIYQKLSHSHTQTVFHFFLGLFSRFCSLALPTGDLCGRCWWKNFWAHASCVGTAWIKKSLCG